MLLVGLVRLLVFDYYLGRDFADALNGVFRERRYTVAGGFILSKKTG